MNLKHVAILFALACVPCGHDIVIGDCDISDWGRLNPTPGFGFDYDAAIYSRSTCLKRLIVQRSKLHHPTYDASTWYEPTSHAHDRAAVHHVGQHGGQPRSVNEAALAGIDPSTPLRKGDFN